MGGAVISVELERMKGDMKGEHSWTGESQGVGRLGEGARGAAGRRGDGHRLWVG